METIEPITMDDQRVYGWQGCAVGEFWRWMPRLIAIIEEGSVSGNKILLTAIQTKQPSVADTIYNAYHFMTISMKYKN